MKFLRSLLALAFLLQASCLAELLHAGGEAQHCAEACGAGESHEEDGASHEACHWQCASCTHPSALTQIAAAPRVAMAAFTLASSATHFIPVPPSANIFHPPA